MSFDTPPARAIACHRRTLLAAAIYSGLARCTTRRPAAPDAREPPARTAAELDALEDGPRREAAILAGLTRGELPRFLRRYEPVAVAAGPLHGVFYAAPDYLGLRDGEGWLRTPMCPATAQSAVDRLGGLLPTRKMVDAIWNAARVRIPFVPLRPHAGQSRGATELYRTHHAAIETLRRGRNGLAAGHKKDIVVGEIARRNPGHVVIYGGWYDDGTRVQPLSAIHSAQYVDYSHGARLIAPWMTVGSHRLRVRDVLRDPSLCALLSDEGPVDAPRYGPA